MSPCLKCKKGDLVEQLTDLDASVKGESVLVTQFPSLVCRGCNYKTVQGKDLPEYMRRAADVYRRKHVLLTSDEIRMRREQLEMSQQEFADYLQVGIASIKRWEMGKVQDLAMDRLMRISTDPMDALENHKKVVKLTTSATSPRRRVAVTKSSLEKRRDDSNEKLRRPTVRAMTAQPSQKTPVDRRRARKSSR